jgi:hypothetical protein
VQTPFVFENLVVENRSNVSDLPVFGGFDIEEQRSTDQLIRIHVLDP